MTRKHFIAIAKAIRVQVEHTQFPEERSLLKALAYDLCAEFRRFNPHFNMDTFLDACGLEES